MFEVGKGVRVSVEWCKDGATDPSARRVENCPIIWMEEIESEDHEEGRVAILDLFLHEVVEDPGISAY